MTLQTTLTLAQMKSTTASQILTDVAANNAKAEIVAELLGYDRISDIVVTHDKSGEVVERVETERDLLTGEVMRSVVTTHSYYASGPVKDIVVSERDAKGKELARRIIHHFADGKQPTVEVTNVKPGEEKPVEIRL